MDTDALKKWPGLTAHEAAEKLRADGYNELSSQKKKNILMLLLKVLMEPMILLLVGCGSIYVLIGDIKDALMLLSFVIVVISITLYQENKTEKTLEKLREYASPRALVIRDGERKRIPGREVVRGDIIVLQEGDRIPADCVVLSCTNLLLDESLLTGESIPVRKSEWNGIIKKTNPGGHDLPYVYAGTMIVSGTGLAQATAIGMETEMGKIGKSIETIKTEDTLLHKETDKIVRYFSLIGFLLCLVVFLIYYILKGEILNGLLAGLTLGMSILPEEFPIVLVIFLTLGAWRISKKHVLTRRPETIETLGAASVLCVDKTGTLTLNTMKLVGLYADGQLHEIPEDGNARIPDKYFNLIDHALLASQREPFDPLEKEIKKVFKDHLAHKDKLYEEWKLYKEYPLSKEHLSLCHVWKEQNNAIDEYTIAVKGAPEAIIDLCHMSETKGTEIMDIVYEMANKGFRVIGVANAMHKGHNLPDDRHAYNFQFQGLLGFVDPIRASVPSSIKEAYKAGIRTIMITGDYAGTAVFIAKKIGLENPEEVMTGQELNSINPQQLKERMKRVNVFARVLPEQKLAIVNALKANGEIVAMTGDGVNDAPALKAANIGIAMGERGTDVAREASSLVVLNDDFSSIVTAVKLGRRIYENLKKAMGYTMAVHLPIAGMAIIPLLLNCPPALLPAHIAFLELVIDPACSTVFESEPEEKDIMSKPPRNINQRLFGYKTVLVALAQGISVLLLVLGIYVSAIYYKLPVDESRTYAFITLVASNLAMIITNLSFKQGFLHILKVKNTPLYYVISGTLVALFAIMNLSFLRSLFHFGNITMFEMMLLLIIGFMSMLWFETGKFLYRIHCCR
jgi:P-type Ca2+ transporter type 2C